MRSEQSTALVELIKYVKRRPSKILILNSRVTIFHEAQQRQQSLSQSLDRDDFKVFILDIDKLSDVEKAKILYNHLAFSEIPDEYLSDIRRDQHYRAIVSHRNYSPRIIEFVCSPKRYHDVAPQNFFDFIMKHLDNPREMWADEYINRLEQVDRVLLQTIYSLTATWIDIDTVRHCFENRINSNISIDKTKDPFSCSLNRLNSGFVKIVDQNGKRGISMYNPSVNDFITARFRNNPAERNDLIRSICCVYQLRILPEEERISYVVDLLQTGRIDTLFFALPEDRSATIGQVVLASGLCMEQYCTEFREYLMTHMRSPYIRFSLFPFNVHISECMLRPHMWETYNMTAFFTEGNNFEEFLLQYDLEESVAIIAAWDHLFVGDDRDKYLSQAETHLSFTLEGCCEVDVSGYSVDTLVESAIHSAYDSEYDDFNVNWAVDWLEEALRDVEYDELQRILDNLPEDLKYLGEDISRSDITIVGADDLIEEYLSNPPGHHESDDDENSGDNDYSPIDAIFER